MMVELNVNNYVYYMWIFVRYLFDIFKIFGFYKIEFWCERVGEIY